MKKTRFGRETIAFAAVLFAVSLFVGLATFVRCVAINLDDSPERQKDARNDEHRKQPEQRELYPRPRQWWRWLESFRTRIFSAHADSRSALSAAIDLRPLPSRVAQTKWQRSHDQYRTEESTPLTESGRT